MFNPFISVVIPTHNAPDLLEEAINSVIQQSYNNWELIIIDDGSNPPVEPYTYTNKYPDKIKFYRNETPIGGSSSKNMGIKKSKGEILAFLDHDDLYSENYLETAVSAFENQPQVDLFFMGIDWFGERAKWALPSYENAMKKILDKVSVQIAEQDSLIFEDDIFYALLYSVPMAFQRPVVKRPQFGKVGFYQDNCMIWDCDWALRATAKKLKTGLINKPLYRQRVAGQGFASRPEKQLEQMLLGLEIKQRILSELNKESHAQLDLKQIKKAIANNFFNIAYYHRTHNNLKKALSAYLKSQQYAPTASSLKFVVAVFIKALKNLFQVK